jgi:hypothetical protein
MRAFILAALALILAGCTYPTSSIEQGAEAGHLKFADGPIGTSLLIDGRERGVRSDGKPVILDVAPGKHVVQEVVGGRVLLHREYDVGAGSTVEVGIDR